MQERRTLFYMDLNDIPSSALLADIDSEGNVLYLPLGNSKFRFRVTSSMTSPANATFKDWNNTDISTVKEALTFSVVSEYVNNTGWYYLHLFDGASVLGYYYKNQKISGITFVNGSATWFGSTASSDTYYMLSHAEYIRRWGGNPLYWTPDYFYSIPNSYVKVKFDSPIKITGIPNLDNYDDKIYIDTEE